MNIIQRAIRYIKKRVKRVTCAQDVPFGAILMLHSIDQPDEHKLWANENLKLSPDTLAAMIEYGRAHGCEFVSLDEMLHTLKHRKYARRQIAITIDDGYRNNYELGLPVFEKYQVPFCINLTTNMMDEKMFYWWYVLEDLLWKHEQIRLSDGRVVECRTKDEKEKAFYVIGDAFLAMHQTELKEQFKELLLDCKYDDTIGAAEWGMTWEQVQNLSHHPLVTLGNHTISHPYMQNCTLDEAKNEVATAQQIIKDHIGQEMQTFAFPYGSHTKEETEMIKHLGFKSFQTVEWDFVKYGTYPYALPRMGVNERNWKEVMDKIIARC